MRAGKVKFVIIEWLEDGGHVRGVGHRVAGDRTIAPVKIAQDLKRKKWAKIIPAEQANDTIEEG